MIHSVIKGQQEKGQILVLTTNEKGEVVAESAVSPILEGEVYETKLKTNL